jgi:hypothetical protein
MNRKLAIFMMSMITCVAFAGNPYWNKNSNQEVSILPPQAFPNQWNPRPVDYCNAGWRYELIIDQPATGYVALAYQCVDLNDGINCEKTISQSDTITNQQAIAQAAIMAQSNAMQNAKSLELQSVENNFLQFCNQLTSTTNNVKLGFMDLETIIMPLMTSDPSQGQMLFDELTELNQAGIYYGGAKWWDTCVWHNNLDMTAARAFKFKYL